MTGPRGPGFGGLDRNRLLAQAADALRRGAMLEVEEASRRVLERERDDPDALNFLGLAALGGNRRREAIDALKKAAGRAPKSAMIRCNLAFALRADGQHEEAVREARKASRLDPDLVAAYSVIGTSLADLGRAAEALEPLTQAIQRQPTLVRVLVALAGVLRALGRADEAAQRYLQAIEVNPQASEAWVGLGWLHVNERRYDEAVRCFRSGLIAKRGSRWWPADGSPLPPPGPPLAINAPKLSHDIEQLSYLRERGLAPDDLAAEIDGYRAMKGEVERIHGESATVMLSQAELGPIADSYARIVHWREAPVQAGGVLGDAWDRREIERLYAVPPGICFLDGLLKEDALEALRRFCLDSTIWNEVGHNFHEEGMRRAYLGTYASDGFCCPLLFQIAEDLTRAMPAIFKDHRLTQMWAYKYEPRMEGIGIHGDNAAVNVNFWITPDEANLDPETGGLMVWPVEAPAAWNFDDYNTDRRKIRRFLDASGKTAVNVPHRRNRAVIFNSDLFHATAPLDFRPGYENRRVNVTMLFGKR